MSRFGASLDWQNGRLRFAPSTKNVPTTHSTTTVNANTTHPSVAAVSKNRVDHPVELIYYLDLRLGHFTLIEEFTDTRPSVDTEGVVEPRLFSEQELSLPGRPNELSVYS